METKKLQIEKDKAIKAVTSSMDNLIAEINLLESEVSLLDFKLEVANQTVKSLRKIILELETKINQSK